MGATESVQIALMMIGRRMNGDFMIAGAADWRHVQSKEGGRFPGVTGCRRSMRVFEALNATLGASE
jgi:hypothetical protein